MLQIGNLQLGPLINEGGNAKVYVANTPDGNQIAVKVLKTKNQKSEGWKRFQSEIRVLGDLTGQAGILPLNAHGEWEGQAWYAMPMAVPIRNALGKASLTEVVKAILDIGETLASLAVKDIYHRDIKPENLFLLIPDKFVIGDFGIHEGPANPELTPDGKRIGPALYCAQEMLSYKESEDHTKADVFSLAKTLWVLATGQTLPLQGQHSMTYTGGWISNYRSEDNTSLLDRILFHATAVDPKERLSMRQFVDDLRAWVTPQQPSATVPIDLSLFGNALADPSRSLQALTTESQRRIKQVHSIVNEDAPKYLSAVRESLASLKGSGDGIAINESSASDQRLFKALTQGTLYNKKPEGWTHYNFTVFMPIMSYPMLEIAIGGAVMGSEIILLAGHILTLNPPIFAFPIRKYSESLRIDSAMAADAINKLSGLLLESLPAAIEQFVDHAKKAIDHRATIARRSNPDRWSEQRASPLKE